MMSVGLSADESAEKLAYLSIATTLIGLVATMGFCLFMWFVFPLPWAHPENRKGGVVSLLLNNFVVPVHAPGGGYLVAGAVLLGLALLRKHRRGSRLSARLLWIATVVNLVPLLSVVIWSACRLLS